MNILIADDSNQKQIIIREFISTEYPSAEITQTYSFSSTINKINSHEYRILLLDMTMPTYEVEEKSKPDNKMRTLAGKDVITKMAYRKKLIPTIIVTQFDVFGRHNHLSSIKDIAEELIHTYPDIVKGYVLFDLQSESWKKDLKVHIEKILND
ncbi:response regulator [Serratia quinivorans]|uniref:hypothetical protein n=1 Tax=Serratia quinivorans TaxID=137545 RepID=UPI0021B6F7E7|nr:hypothetical protein [Serratia quinivorans]